MTTPRRLAAATALLLVPGLLTAGAAAPAASATPSRVMGFHQWAGNAQLAQGYRYGVAVSGGSLRIAGPRYRATFQGARYDVGRWTSRWVPEKFPLTELIPSWQAQTPRGTFLSVLVRARRADGRIGSWDRMGAWAAGDTPVHRTTFGAQRDDLGRVATDTWITNGGAVAGFQVRVLLYRRTGTTATPQLDTLSVMTSRIPAVSRVATSRPGVARGVVLNVPRYSQMVHTGQYPQYGGGGEAWCSPTSTTMVLAYYRKLPPARWYRWVNQAYADRVVDSTARMTYDYGYGGTGNWPFNTAYAATRTGHAFVTRIGSLRGVERMIRAGIPVITSITFGRGELHGAPIGASNGHLVVVVGFTSTGDVVVNDPAAPRNAGVRRVYDRGEFENAWLKRYPSGGSMRGSGGLAYIIRDDAHPLPARHGSTSW